MKKARKGMTSLLLWMDVATKKELREVAKETDRNMAQVIRAAIKAFLDARKTDGGGKS